MKKCPPLHYSLSRNCVKVPTQKYCCKNVNISFIIAFFARKSKTSDNFEIDPQIVSKLVGHINQNTESIKISTMALCDLSKNTSDLFPWGENVEQIIQKCLHSPCLFQSTFPSFFELILLCARYICTSRELFQYLELIFHMIFTIFEGLKNVFCISKSPVQLNSPQSK